jgi:hypothetical protein
MAGTSSVARRSRFGDQDYHLFPRRRAEVAFDLLQGIGDRHGSQRPNGSHPPQQTGFVELRKREDKLGILAIAPLPLADSMPIYAQPHLQVIGQALDDLDHSIVSVVDHHPHADLTLHRAPGIEDKLKLRWRSDRCQALPRCHHLEAAGPTAEGQAYVERT